MLPNYEAVGGNLQLKYCTYIHLIP